MNNTTQCLEGIYSFKYTGREKRLKNQLSKFLFQEAVKTRASLQ